MMNAPTVLVTAALTTAILLMASFLIATGTRGEPLPAKRGVETGIRFPDKIFRTD